MQTNGVGELTSTVHTDNHVNSFQNNDDYLKCVFDFADDTSTFECRLSIRVLNS